MTSKTSEYFTDYRFEAPGGLRVSFKLRTADVEKDNVKGDKRFFIPLAKEAVFDGNANGVVVPFEYRPLTEQEDIKYGARNQQDAIIAEALSEIPRRFENNTKVQAALLSEFRKGDQDRAVSQLEHHLRQYTRRNTSDFFVHKNLKGFLTRELDFYLKNEVLNLDDLEAAGETNAGSWFQLMRAVKNIGAKIIEFLAQIEDFQKMLFEKRKFVTETQYCITVQNVPKEFYAEIAQCEGQWQEWRDLFHIDEEEQNLFAAVTRSKVDRRIAFLKDHPTLVVDTRYVNRDSKDRLLASFDNLDDMTDGLLVHSENFQALNLLMEKYREKIKCIYIDPPYNTAASEILYKNDYKHSSWLTMMSDRVQTSMGLMGDTSILCVAIDDYELPLLMSHLRHIFGEAKDLSTVVVRSNPHGRAMASGFSPNHEYALFFSQAGQVAVGRLPRNEKRRARYPESDAIGVFTWINFRKTGAGSARSDRPKLYYPVFVSSGGSVHVPSMNWSETSQCWEPTEQPAPHESVVLPLDAEGAERVWNLGWQRAQNECGTDLKASLVDGGWQVFRKYRPNQDGALPGTWWEDAKYSATESGTRVIKDLFGERDTFPYPKSVHLTEDCLRASGCSIGSLTLDYFAGSGTTAHAAINLNREDGGQRKFVLVEMGDCFDTVLLPRIKKVTFTPEWKDGKPARQATEEEAQRSPRIVKYIRLESYEDALNNIEFGGQAGQMAMKFDDYLLSYMLDWETRESPTRLSVKRLVSPFNYRLQIIRHQETTEQAVDLPETFAYLMGLHIKTRRVYRDGDRPYLVYRGHCDHREIAVVWRETAGWEQKDYEGDKAFVTHCRLAEGADQVFVNGDSLIPRARSLDGVFKARMFAPVPAGGR